LQVSGDDLDEIVSAGKRWRYRGSGPHTRLLGSGNDALAGPDHVSDSTLRIWNIEHGIAGQPPRRLRRERGCPSDVLGSAAGDSSIEMMGSRS
jgi:hypothetical protein